MEVHSNVVADLLGCSQVWVHKLRKTDGESPPYQKRGNKYFYSLGAVIRWVIDRQTRPLVEQIEASETRVQHLENRLAVIEKTLAKLIANSPERKAARLRRHMRALDKRIVAKIAAENTNEVIPY